MRNWLLILLLPLNGFAQDTCAILPIKKFFFKADRTDGMDSVWVSDGWYDISLYTGFNDSCILSINDTVLLNRRIQVEFSLGITTSLIMSSARFKGPLKLNIFLVDNKICLTEFLELNREFWTVRIYRNQLGWTLNYTNHFPILE